jgi:glycosyltransferase involved in cell wall biosynthesis
MKISVVIPVRNGERYLARCLDSILIQDMGQYELEILVQDNFSSDLTHEVVKRFSDPRISFFRTTEFLPAWENWTQISKKSTGDFVKLLPVDDTLVGNGLKFQANVLSNNPELSFVASSRKLTIPSGRELPRFLGSLGLVGSFTIDQIAERLVDTPRNVFGEPGCVMFRGDVFRALLPWSLEAGYAIDLDFYLRALRFGSVEVLKDFHSTFQISESSWSNQVVDRQTRETANVIVKFLQENNIVSKRVLGNVLKGIELRTVARKLLYKILFGIGARWTH